MRDCELRSAAALGAGAIRAPAGLMQPRSRDVGPRGRFSCLPFPSLCYRLGAAGRERRSGWVTRTRSYRLATGRRNSRSPSPAVRTSLPSTVLSAAGSPRRSLGRRVGSRATETREA